jgi:hypothetical protein
MRYERWLPLILVPFTVANLTGCGITDPATETEGSSESGYSDQLERTAPKKLARKEAEQIFEYLKNEDIASLSALFSQEAKDNHDLEKEWKDFFSRIDGKLTGYGGISFPGEGMGVDKEGVIYDSHLSINFNDSVTDTGTVYKDLGYYQTRINTADPRTEGINVFTVKIPGKDGNNGEYITVGGIGGQETTP